jgi:two-component system nitrate/nitrite response regulator NarL
VSPKGPLRPDAVAPRRPTRVVILAEIRFYREGLALFFADRDDFEVIGTAEGAAAAAELALKTAVDVTLVDVTAGSTPRVIRALKRTMPNVRVVALGVPEAEQEVIPLVEAGVTGLVSREDSLDELADAVNSAARGETRCSARVAAMLVRRVAVLSDQLPEAEHFPLTKRQLEVVRLIDEGLPNKAIAQRLFIEVPTVKNHVHNILERLGVERREQAAPAVRRLSTKLL